MPTVTVFNWMFPVTECLLYYPCCDVLLFIFRTDLVSTGLSKPGSIVENLKKISKNGEERCVGFLMAKIFKLNELVCATRYAI